MTICIYFVVSAITLQVLCYTFVACRDSNSGYQQESVLQMDECLRTVVPSQIYILCCMRENNCSVSRYQAKGMDCISRVAAANSTLLMGSQTNNQQQSSSDRWMEGEIIRRAVLNCRTVSNSRQPMCIKNELSRYCQNEMTMQRSGYGSRLYNRRGRRIPSSAWDSSMYPDSYPMDSVEWRRRGIYPPDMSYYPRTFMSRRLYGRDSGSRGYGGSSSYGGSYMGSSYGDDDYGSEEGSYGSQMDESYSG